MEVDLASASLNYDREHVSRWVESVDFSAPSIDDDILIIDADVPYDEGLMNEAVAFASGSSSAVYNEEGDCPVCKDPFEHQSITVLVCGSTLTLFTLQGGMVQRTRNCPIFALDPTVLPNSLMMKMTPTAVMTMPMIRIIATMIMIPSVITAQTVVMIRVVN